MNCEGQLAVGVAPETRARIEIKSTASVFGLLLPMHSMGLNLLSLNKSCDRNCHSKMASENTVLKAIKTSLNESKATGSVHMEKRPIFTDASSDTV